MAASEPTTDAELIKRLSYRPSEIDACMIRVKPATEPSRISRSNPSSIGSLDTLSLEMLHLVLDWLDFQSIYRFSLASVRAREVAQALPASRELLRHAPAVLAAFGRTRLIMHHTAAKVRATLRSWKCVACANYGAFIFLPTCDRCCWQCLDNNQALWLLARGVAARCFSLSSAELDRLPTLLSIPGEYGVGLQSRKFEDRQKLVSLSAAKELALSIHGSQQEIYQRAWDRRPKVSQMRLAQYRYYQDAQLVQPKLDIFARRNLGDITMDDPYSGMASMPFPAITDKGVENGLWCRGCDYMFETYGLRFFPAKSKFSQPWMVFTGTRRRSFSQSEFLTHIRTCYGVQRIAIQAGLETWIRGLHDLAAPPRPLSEVLALLLLPEAKPDKGSKDKENTEINGN
ncbi:hypothetical protein HJFPF1_09809 [Paramyrothecium foliicola]|nr:hypothetical protein HJFPF1_09809 [Paramyrothecium foliicola]